MTFEAWWSKAKHDFDSARATSFYRYQLPAFTDLYGVDFDRITDDQARALNDRIFDHYQDPKWLYHVVTERANIELMFNDPYWARLEFHTDYPFGVLVFNVTTLVSGFHPSEFKQPADDPYLFAQQRGPEGRHPRRLPAGARPAVPEGQGRRGGVPEDDARLPAIAPLRERSQGPCRQGVGPSPRAN